MNFLLVGGDRNVGLCLRRRIEGAGHILDWTGEGRQAFECASSARYDAVIVDLGSSDMPGVELCAQLRRVSQALPILVLSASDLVAERLESFSAGADDVLVKPFDFDELMARLAAIQRRKAPTQVPAARPTQMIVFDRKSSDARRTRHIVGLTDHEFHFFDGLLKRKTSDVSLVAAFREACDLDVDMFEKRASGPKIGIGLYACLATVQSISRRFVVAGARLGRRRS